MDDQILIRRLKLNYRVLAKLYRQGKFEEEVYATDLIDDADKFYFVVPDELENKTFFRHKSDDSARGYGRHPRDLQWATTNLREQAHYLFEKYSNGGASPIPDALRREVVLYFFRAFSLSYEVDDYFLSVNKNTSDFLIKLSHKIKDSAEIFLAVYNDLFPAESPDYEQLVKEVLIVALCGVNECYRRHKYDEGLEIASVIESYADKNHPYHGNEKGRGFGLKGLRHFVVGRILTARGDFNEAEREFRYSVEAYSESIWQKERVFFQQREALQAAEKKAHGGEITDADCSKLKEDFSKIKEQYELSRGLALRRCGLANSFGYGFQALVLGKVKDAIRLSSISRGIVNLNTGKIHSSYVDLIYYSAKRAEKSSDRRQLLTVLKNLQRCRRVFEDLIPKAHYKNRASFQISFVYHYLARWYKELAFNPALTTNNNRHPVQQRDRLWNLKKAHRYWQKAAALLEANVTEHGIAANKRLKAESLAILGHAYGNLGLLEKEFKSDRGLAFMQQADVVVRKAWNEAEKYPQIKCEVGLARAAVNKANVEFLMGGKFLNDDKRDLFPYDSGVRDDVRELLKNARRALNEVLTLNSDNGVRVQATVYLRLTELALLQKDTWYQAREHYNKYLKISAGVEHQFCHRWAQDLEKRLLRLEDDLIFKINRGGKYSKEQLDEDLYDYVRRKAINFAALEIEQQSQTLSSFKKTDSVSSYLEWALTHELGFPRSTAQDWIKDYPMIAHLRLICPAAEQLEDFVRRKKTNTQAASKPTLKNS